MGGPEEKSATRTRLPIRPRICKSRKAQGNLRARTFTPKKQARNLTGAAPAGIRRSERPDGGYPRRNASAPVSAVDVVDEARGIFVGHRA
jgi:hypothetical protein